MVCPAPPNKRRDPLLRWVVGVSRFFVRAIFVALRLSASFGVGVLAGFGVRDALIKGQDWAYDAGDLQKEWVAIWFHLSGPAIDILPGAVAGTVIVVMELGWRARPHRAK